jgi:3-oxoacyl-[acyl-carrier protein] reductase
MELQLENKHIVITGGTKGIGLAIANAFLKEGSHVHVISRSNDLNGFKSIEEEENYSRLFSYQCDVTNENDLLEVSNDILKNSGNSIDILISNVGTGKSLSNPINDSEVWNQSWDLNFTSALNTARVFSPYINPNGGSIIFISSIAGMEYLGAPTEYGVAKSALIAFSKSLSHKLAPAIRVNTVAPGNIYFPGGTWDLKLKEDAAKVNAMLNSKVPLQRFGTPAEVADLILFLSSNHASFITGGCFAIDGGQTSAF